MIIGMAYCILTVNQTQLDSAKWKLIHIFCNGSVHRG